MQSVLDDDDRKRLHEKPRFELAAKGGKMLHLLILLTGRFRSLVDWISNRESTATDG